MESEKNAEQNNSIGPVVMLVLGLVLIAIGGVVMFMMRSEDSINSENEEGENAEVNENLFDGPEYSFEVPAGWIEDDGSLANLDYERINARVFFPEVEIEETDGFAENINVLVQKADQYTQSDYHNLSVNQIEALESEIFLNNTVDVSGMEGNEIGYTVGESTYYQRYVIKDGKAYLMTYTGSADEYDLYLDDAMMFFDTFMIK